MSTPRSVVRRRALAAGSTAALAAILVVGCSDSTAPDLPSIVAPGGPSLAIVDATNGGAPGFFFLSPIATALPSYPGTFDPGRAPVVEICKWVSGACSGPLVASYSGAAVTMSASGQYYRADWPTAALPTGVLYRLRVLENGTELGYAEAKKPGAGETAVTLTAQKIVPLGNSSALAIRFRLSVNIVSVPATLTLPFGGTASLPISLATPAPAAGIAFTVTSNNGSTGVSTSTVTVPGGAQIANATLTGLAPGAATVKVSNIGYGSASTQVSTTASLAFVGPAVSIVQGVSQDVTVQLTSNGAPIAAPPGGLLVVTSPIAGGQGCVAVTSPVAIAAGASSGTATVSYGGAAPTPCTASITATVPGTPQIASASLDVTVQTPPLLTLTLGATRIGAGLRQSGVTRVGLAAPAPAGGVVVTLTSANPMIARVSATLSGGPDAAASTTALIPSGASSVDFVVDGVEGASGTVTLMATAPGSSAVTGDVVVTAVGVHFTTVVSSFTTSSAASPLIAEIGPLTLDGMALVGPQTVRPGGTPVVVTFTSSDAFVAPVVTSSATGATVTAAIAAGASATPSTLAGGGVVVDPNEVGATTLAVAGAGLTPVAPSSMAVTVTGPSLSVAAIGEIRVGSGLRLLNSIIQVTLATPAPAGGVSVVLSSQSPSVALAAPFSTTAASSPAASVVVSPGNTVANFTVDGMEGQTGVVTMTVTATGYAGTTTTVTVLAPQVTLFARPQTSIAYTAGNVAISALIGVLSIDGNSFFGQPVRPGGTPVAVTFNSSTPSGQLVSQTASGASVTLTLPPGQAFTPSTLATGGVEFDPITPGLTTLSVGGAGLTPAQVGSMSVFVSGPSLSMFGQSGNRVGSGLRLTGYRVGLSTPAPTGGVTVTLTSQSPSLALAAPASPANAPSAAVLTLSIPAGGTFVDFSVDGMEGVTGDVTFTATAFGYAAVSSIATVTQTGVQFSSIFSGTFQSTQSNTAATARVGALNAAGTIVTVQSARPGGPGIPVVFTSSNPATVSFVTSTQSGASVTAMVLPGASTTPATLAQGGVECDYLEGGTATLSIGGSGLVPVSTFTVTAVVTNVFFSLGPTVGPARVGAGLRFQGVVRASIGVRSVDVSMTLTSLTPNRLRVAPAGTSTAATAAATVVIPAGASFADFHVDGVEGAGTGDVALSAKAVGYVEQTTTISVTSPGVRFVTVPVSGSIAFSPNNIALSAQVGALDAPLTGLQYVQNVRPGGPPLAVTFASNNPGVAQVVTSSGAGATATVFVAAGQSAVPSTLALGGAEIHMVDLGTTTISVGGTGLVPCALSSTQMTITGPALSMSVTAEPRVGAGLRWTGVMRVGLGGSPAPAGGVTVVLTSPTPSRALVAAAPATGVPGAPTASVFIPAGASTSADFVIDGVEGGGSGVVNFQATAPGYIPASATVTVAPVAVRFTTTSPGLPPTVTSTFSNNVATAAEVGAVDASGTAMTTSGPQAVRPGGVPLTFTFASNHPELIRMITSTDAGGSVTASVAVGASRTPATLAAGGVELDYLDAGLTQVSVGGPGTSSVTTSSLNVTTVAPTLTGPAAFRLGRGLRSITKTVQFGAPVPAGGTTLTITSLDPALAGVAPVSPTPTVATTSIAIPVAAGATSATFFIDGMEGASGPVTIQMSAPLYQTATTTVTLAAVGLTYNVGPVNAIVGQVFGLVPFIGALDLAGTAIPEGTSGVRPGGVALNVTFTSSNPIVAHFSGLVASVTLAYAPGGPAPVAFVTARTPGTTVLSLSGVAFTVLSGATGISTITSPMLELGWAPLFRNPAATASPFHP